MFYRLCYFLFQILQDILWLMQSFDRILTISPWKIGRLIFKLKLCLSLEGSDGKIQSEAGRMRIQNLFLDNAVKLTLVKSSSGQCTGTPSVPSSSICSCVPLIRAMCESDMAQFEGSHRFPALWLSMPSIQGFHNDSAKHIYLQWGWMLFYL